MQIRRLEVANFRGIRKGKWDIDGRLLCLIGAGDSTKSTLLDAIEVGLSPRWNVVFSDDDFFEGDLTHPIEIVVTLGDLPRQFLDDRKYGLYIRGWTGSDVVDEPNEGDEEVISIRLRVDASLEPTWVVFNERDQEGKPIPARDRANINVIRLGGNFDRHFSWGRDSALSAITESIDAAKDFVGAAHREVRQKVNSEPIVGLTDIATKSQIAAKELGVRVRAAYSPLLDTKAFAANTGAVGLYDGKVPLRQAGLGSKRLAAIAIQSLGLKNSAIVLIDEVEHGLEPFRLRHFLRKLKEMIAKQESPLSQVLLTSHSPTALLQLDSENVLIVRSITGDTSLRPIPSEVFGILKKTPEAPLSERILVCEGLTEMGICEENLNDWETERKADPIALTGTSIVNGGGVQSAASTAYQLNNLGYEVALFIDSDQEPSISIAKLLEVGITVLKWSDKVSTEERICLDVPEERLLKLLEAASRFHNRESLIQSIRQRLANASGGKYSENDLSLSPNEWSTQVGVDYLRQILGQGAKKGEWFKTVDGGRALAEFVKENFTTGQTNTEKTIMQVGDWLYGKRIS